MFLGPYLNFKLILWMGSCLNMFSNWSNWYIEKFFLRVFYSVYSAVSWILFSFSIHLFLFPDSQINYLQTILFTQYIYLFVLSYCFVRKFWILVNNCNGRVMFCVSFRLWSLLYTILMKCILIRNAYRILLGFIWFLY